MQFNMGVFSSAAILFLVVICGSAKNLKPHKNVGIFGGSSVSIAEVPFMARYQATNRSEIFCGAAIVSDKIVITAAHCYEGFEAFSLEAKVVLGSDKLRKGQDYEIEETHIHPNWSLGGYDYDIAVLQLKTNLTFSDYVKAVPMAEEDLVLKDGDLLDAIGFGMTQNNEVSQDLLKVSLPYVPNDTCDDIFKTAPIPAEITDDMLCAGGEKGKDTCWGDSGGPIFFNNVIVGLTSFGGSLQCGTEGIPGVYARISALRSFVQKFINA